MLMKLFALFSTLLVSALLLPAQDAAQPAAAKSRYVSTIGEVLSIDAAAKQVKVKTDKGEEVTIALQDQTSYLRMPPGEKELSKATRIELKDIGPGDRVLARTRAEEGGGMGPAASIIMMTKADLAEFHEKSRAEWEKRGTVGTVASVDPDLKEITIVVPAGLTPKDTKNILVDLNDKLVYRRYAPGSAKFQDAKPSTLAEIKPGDRIRVLGDKNEDGSHIKAEEVVTGTFRTLAVTIVSIDPASNTVKANVLPIKKGAPPVTVKINADTSIKRLPPRMAMMLASLQSGGTGGAAGEGGGARGGSPGRGGAGAGAGGEGAAGGGRGGGMRGGAASLPQMIERLPQITLADLKAGDALVISAVAGKDASEVTAITAIAGVEAIITAPSKGGGSAVGGNWNFGDIGMPQ
jgi:Cu/Ag efflux protein CusF